MFSLKNMVKLYFQKDKKKTSEMKWQMFHILHFSFG